MNLPNSGDSRPPDPQPSHRPATPNLQPLEAPLSPVTGSKLFRPPRADAPLPTPKPSAAPAPRLRPSAPSQRGEAPTPDPQESPADQLADLLAAQRSAQGSAQRSTVLSPPQPAAVPAHTPSISPQKILATTADPFFFRKMIIPILFTFGLVLAGWATLILTAGEDSAMSDMFPHWIPTALYILASIFLLLTLINTLAIRRDTTSGRK